MLEGSSPIPSPYQNRISLPSFQRPKPSNDMLPQIFADSFSNHDTIENFGFV